MSARGNESRTNGRTGAVSTLGFVMASVAILAALILMFHTHQCPPGWTAFDFDAPVGAASLIVTLPLLLVNLSSALVSFGAGNRFIRRVTFKSLPLVAFVATLATVMALLLGWGALSNLSSSTNGCLTF